MDDATALQTLSDVAARGQRMVTTHEGAGMAWQVFGEGSPLVLLHGGSGSWNHWIRTVGHFAGRHRVLAADLPGLGDSDLPAGRYSAESLADAVAAGIAALLAPDEAFELTGFSFGGIVGGHVALRLGARMNGLTIVGSPPFGLGSTGPANAVEPVDPALDFEAARPLHERNLARLMIADVERIDALAVRAHHDNLRRARLRSRKIARTDTLARAIRSLDCPLSGIWGSRDVTIDPNLAAIRELFETHPRFRSFDVIDGAGHWVAFEAADTFNALLARQLGLPEVMS